MKPNTLRLSWGYTIILCACALSQAQAQTGPSHKALVARGQHIAELICAPCHLVIRDQEFPPFLKIQTPSFYEIASRPDVNERMLRHFIGTTHWDEKSIPMTMPNQELTAEQLSAVVAYILSLKPGAAAR